jgi:hypothetical protein
MNNYTAYGLGINSALPLPELQTAAEAATDVTIRFGCIDWSPDGSGEEFCFEVIRNESHFFWPHLGKFRVSRGAEILIDSLPRVEERLLRLPLLGTIVAVLLQQRGYLVLHASSVAVNGGALVFIGNKGWGKSTMAATLYGRGHDLISDDVVALKLEGQDAPLVMPGFPQFKLFPEAIVSSLGDDYETLPELAAGHNKRGRLVTDRFARQPLPLKSVYALGCGPVSAIKALEPQAALLALIVNSYSARFGKRLLRGVEASAHLRQCSRIVRQVPIYRLERPKALPLLPAVAQLVEEHLHYLERGAASREDLPSPENTNGRLMTDGRRQNTRKETVSNTQTYRTRRR